MRFIVIEYRRDLKQQWYVAARPGYCRKTNGTYSRSGSFKGGPEWTTNPNHAFKFNSHRSAARVATKCPSANIQKVA